MEREDIYEGGWKRKKWKGSREDILKGFVRQRKRMEEKEKENRIEYERKE